MPVTLKVYFWGTAPLGGSLEEMQIGALPQTYSTASCAEWGQPSDLTSLGVILMLREI